MILKLAFRNALRQKRRSLFTVFTMVGGFVLGSVAISMTYGSFNNVIDSFTRTSTGHIQIHCAGYLDKPSIYKTIDDYSVIGEKIQHIKGVKSYAPRLVSAGLVSVGEKSNAAKIIGIDPNLEDETTLFSKRIENGRMFTEKPEHRAIIGKGLAKNLNAKIADTIVILSQAADGSIANDMYEIIGIYDSGNEMADRATIYLNLADAQDLFVLPNSVHEIVVVLSNFKITQKVLGEIESKLNNPKIDIQSWQVIAKSFYESMEAKKQGNYIMNLIIILIVAIGVFNTVLMSVLERTREYGLLKALGTRPWQIIKLVIYEIVLLSFTSVIIGSVISTAANYFLLIHGITYPISFNIGGIQMNKMIAEISVRSYLIPTIIVLVAAFLVSIIPALQAAKTEPAKSMHHL
ncbi:ABC transporter permease [bacterium]|nr:ABC transporter permease [bacterium]